MSDQSLTQVNFYHLTASPMERALPKLLEKVLASNARALVLTQDAKRAEDLNTVLWTYGAGSFLPHGTREDGSKDQQPIFITERMENPNHASVLVLIDDKIVEALNGFEKCLYLFDGTAASSVTKAREFWKQCKQSGYQTSYFQQNAKGNWEQQTGAATT